MSRKKNRTSDGAATPEATTLRIIGGQMRGRPLRYHGDPLTRPMKDRVREAVFNLLGPSIKGTLALDLFAGTGALALEAISRGAARAVCVERHFPSARLIGQNARDLGVADRVQTVAGDTFVWAQHHAGLAEPAASGLAWVVFCSPPYDLYVDRRDDMIALIQRVVATAPHDSLLVVESDERFDVADAIELEWDVRVYRPAVIAIGTTKRDA